MNVKEQIAAYIAGQPESKREDMQELHRRTLKALPRCKLWFHDGKDDKGKVVTNPTIGYGVCTIEYADGTTKDAFQIGLSANATGISVYLLGLKDKTFLTRTYSRKLGKAKVTGYCIRFKSLDDIDVDVLDAAIRAGVEPKNQKTKAKK